MPDETVPDLYHLAFVPGLFRCPECNFQLCKTIIRTSDGQYGTTEKERTSEPCPNDNTMMVHVTYKEQLDAYADRFKEELNRADERDRMENLRVSEAFRLIQSCNTVTILSLGEMESVVRRALAGEFDGGIDSVAR